MRTSNASRVVALFLPAVLSTFVVTPRSRAGFSDDEAEATEKTLAAPVEQRREATERRVHAVAAELAKTAKQYGPDSVSLQASLLVHSMSAGAIGACEVTVVGASPSAGPSFLELDVDTGLVFDTGATTERGRMAHLWREIALPALLGMKSFQTEPPGLELVFEYGLQSYTDQIENKPDMSAPIDGKILRVTIPEAVLSDLAVGAIEADAVLSRSTVHDEVREIPAHELVFDVVAH